MRFSEAKKLNKKKSLRINATQPDLEQKLQNLTGNYKGLKVSVPEVSANVINEFEEVASKSFKVPNACHYEFSTPGYKITLFCDYNNAETFEEIARTLTIESDDFSQIPVKVLNDFNPSKEVNLRKLTLPYPGVEPAQELIRPKKQIKSLVLHDIWFNHEDQIRGFLPLFPNILKLHFSCVEMKEIVIDDADLIRNVLRVYKNLDELIVTEPSRHFLERLALMTSDSLTTLTINQLDVTNNVNLLSIFANFPQLKSLTIDIKKGAEIFEFGLLLSSAHINTRISMRGKFKLTENHLRAFSLHRHKGLELAVPRGNVRVSHKLAHQILGHCSIQQVG